MTWGTTEYATAGSLVTILMPMSIQTPSSQRPKPNLVSTSGEFGISDWPLRSKK